MTSRTTRYPSTGNGELSPAFLELKGTLNPRFYAAFRGGYEFAVGYRVNRFQTLKVGYEVFRTTDVPGSQDNVFGVQFVTSVHALSKAFGN